MTVGAFGPAYDYQKGKLQSLEDSESTVEHLSLSVLSNGTAAVAALVWPKTSAVGIKFAQTLIAEPAELLTTLLIQTAVKLIENTCFAIPWWDSLKNGEKHVLTSWMETTQQTPDMLIFSGIKFDDWGYVSHEFKNL